jgi:hypothetical protein
VVSAADSLRPYSLFSIPDNNLYIYKNVTVRLCVVRSKSQSSESRAPMALQFGYNVAGEYAHV